MIFSTFLAININLLWCLQLTKLTNNNMFKNVVVERPFVTVIVETLKFWSFTNVFLQLRLSVIRFFTNPGDLFPFPLPMRTFVPTFKEVCLINLPIVVAILYILESCKECNISCISNYYINHTMMTNYRPRPFSYL